MKKSELQKIIQEEVRKVIQEETVIPVGPDGNKITDKTVIQNLNLAVKAIDSSIRTKVSDLLTDPSAAKALKTPAQRTALIGAIAITFGISEKEFSQIVNKIKDLLRKTDDQA